jgi:hypothetical protein
MVRIGELASSMTGIPELPRERRAGLLLRKERDAADVMHALQTEIVRN